jgi:hypothetical protein
MKIYLTFRIELVYKKVLIIGCIAKTFAQLNTFEHKCPQQIYPTVEMSRLDETSLAHAL